MKTLTEVKNELRDILPNGIDLIFTAIKNYIPRGTGKYAEVILLESRYRDIVKQIVQGVLSHEDSQLGFNRIRKDILEFIDSLEEQHLAQATGN